MKRLNLILLLIASNLVCMERNTCLAQTETFSSGSFVVDMGQTPQTVDNALRPYGLLYELIEYHDIPIQWIISPYKTRDGIDFSYNGVDYKSGPFLIEAEHIDSTIAALITAWDTTGVQGSYTTSSITFPSNYIRTVKYFPNILVDDLSGNAPIILNYYNNAGIDSNAYEIGTPADLTICHDLWVNPHGDPVWATHGPLYNFATTQASHIWSQCHAVSMLEGTENTAAPYEMLNYLTIDGMKCWKTKGGQNPAATCGPSITETHPKNETAPFSYFYPTDPVMQLLGNIHNAHDNGSEQWFQPLSTGAWRGTTKRLVTTSDGSSPGEGVLAAYGHAFGNSENGLVMYQGGHDLTGSGSTEEQIAAQRAFFNFNLLCGRQKELFVSSSQIPNSYYQGQTRNVYVNVSSGYPPYTYEWSNTIGGTFGDSTAASTTFTAPMTAVSLDGMIKVVVTDACGRKNIFSVPINIFITGLPVALTDFTARANDQGEVLLNWTTQSEINNDYFTIVRSQNGFDREPLAMIPGAGHSTTPLNYAWVDHEPLTGTSYYFLDQTDYNGDSETYGPVRVALTPFSLSPLTPLVHPNPATSTTYVSFQTDSDHLVDIRLFNTLGESVLALSHEATEGPNRVELSGIRDLPKGVYLLHLAHDGLTGTSRFVKH